MSNPRAKAISIHSISYQCQRASSHKWGAFKETQGFNCHLSHPRGLGFQPRCDNLVHNLALDNSFLFSPLSPISFSSQVLSSSLYMITIKSFILFLYEFYNMQHATTRFPLLTHTPPSHDIESLWNHVSLRKGGEERHPTLLFPNSICILVFGVHGRSLIYVNFLFIFIDYLL